MRASQFHLSSAVFDPTLHQFIALLALSIVLIYTLISQFLSLLVEVKDQRIKLRKEGLAKTGQFLALNREDVPLLHGISQTTATVFEIEDKDGIVPLEWLHERIQHIVFQNIWLLAKLCSGNNKQDIPNFWVPNDPIAKNDIDVSNHVLVAEVHNLSQALKNCDAYACKSGVLCVDQDIPLWKVTILKSSQSRKFAIVMSINHTLGDGSTFYKIFGMLTDHNVEIFPMEMKRVFPSDLGPETALRLQALYSEVKAGVMPGFLRRKWNYIRRRTYAMNTEFRIIDPDKIKQIKEGIKAEFNQLEHPNFVSTNDILVSSLLPKSSLGLVPMDLRDKLNGITQEHAGNYIFLTTLLPKEHSTPLEVRKFVNNIRRKLTCKPEELSIVTNVATASDCDGISVSTNWTTFYRHPNLDGCKSLMHFPVHELFPFPATTVFKLNESVTAIRIDSTENNYSFLGNELLPFNF